MIDYDDETEGKPHTTTEDEKHEKRNPY